MRTILYLQNYAFAVLRIRRPMTKAGKIFTGVLLLLIGGIPAALMLWMKLFDVIMCRHRTPAEVIRLDESTVTNPKTQAASQVYAPVFAYEFNGRRYETVSGAYQADPAHAVGDRTEIFVDAENPAHIREKHGDLKGFLALWMFFVALALVGVGMFISAFTS